MCIGEFEDADIVRVLPCAHEFHKTCVDPWLSSHHTCPLCKFDILGEDEDSEEGEEGEGAEEEPFNSNSETYTETVTLHSLSHTPLTDPHSTLHSPLAHSSSVELAPVVAFSSPDSIIRSSESARLLADSDV